MELTGGIDSSAAIWRYLDVTERDPPSEEVLAMILELIICVPNEIWVIFSLAGQPGHLTPPHHPLLTEMWRLFWASALTV